MSGSDAGASVLSSSVYQILGGRGMDRLLVGRSLDLIGVHIPGSRMLDNGVGIGINTLQYWKMGPASLVATDFQQETLDKAREFWQNRGENPDRVSWLLHDASTPLPEGIGYFNLIKHSSVVMHLDPQQSRESIQNQAQHLCIGGKMQISAVSTDFARKNFIPVPDSKGLKFLPRAKGMTLETTYEDLSLEQLSSCHAEWYPPTEHYDEVCEMPGFRVIKHQAIIGDEFEGTIYADCKGEAYWDIWVITRLPLVI